MQQNIPYWYRYKFIDDVSLLFFYFFFIISIFWLFFFCKYVSFSPEIIHPFNHNQFWFFFFFYFLQTVCLHIFYSRTWLHTKKCNRRNVIRRRKKYEKRNQCNVLKDIKRHDANECKCNKRRKKMFRSSKNQFMSFCSAHFHS